MEAYDQRIPQLKQLKPKGKGNRKLIALLLLFFLVLLAVLFFRSPYSKVSEIAVSGNALYSEEQIVAASGLKVGMQFLNVWESRVRENLRQLKGVQDVALVRSFPGLIKLEVKEYKRVAYILSEEDGRKVFPLLENGYVLNDGDVKQLIVDKPLIRSWQDPALLGPLANALAQLSPAVLAQISDISLTPTPYDPQRITLYMRDGNEVRSVIHQLAKKMAWYPSIVSELPEGEKGIIYLLESAWFSRYSSSDKQELVPPEAEKESTEG
ncbi:cell division protein FtsQ/DivIB [Brevibacillus marinus]|uniref:cell division protein FtsQ/DivIB n=1 Tax=Brevibacillus marinus TaxID=2496837 RepID=UPI000F82C64C|nr:FtsQ-type POTRA domain-containing protein [Brevibacillus marinus]